MFSPNFLVRTNMMDEPPLQSPARDSRAESGMTCRAIPGFQPRWLLLPAAWGLLASGLSLRRHGYTGVLVRPDNNGVVSVDAGSPGAAAGIVAGGRLLPADPSRLQDVLAQDPLADA